MGKLIFDIADRVKAHFAGFFIASGATRLH